MLKANQQPSVSLSTPEFMAENAAEEEADDEETPTPTPTPTSPFWIQSNNLKRNRLSSLFFNSFMLIIFLLLFAILSLVFIIIPSLVNLSSNVNIIFKPNSVKRSWDSINFILVFIALVFGFLSRRNIDINDDEKMNFDTGFDRRETEVSAGAPITYDFQDQLMNSTVGLRRQRTSISYPDLRELSPPLNHPGPTDPWRFSDDTHLNYYHVLDSNRNSFRQRSRREYNPGIRDAPSPEMASPGKKLYFLAPQPPPVNPVKQKMKKNGGERSIGSGSGKVILSPETELSEKNGAKDERKRGNIEKRRARSSEPKRILSPVIDPDPDPDPTVPLTGRKKVDRNANKNKKKRFHRSVDNLGALLTVKSQPLVPRGTIARVAPFVTDKPGGVMMTVGFNGVDDSSSGGESPMKNIPPPPPLPPFKMPDWKFKVEGDFVRLQSTLSSGSGSPDGDEARSPLSDVDTALTTTLYSPSPDVDLKADSFIARFRAGLKLERMSKLGPGPISSPSDF